MSRGKQTVSHEAFVRAWVAATTIAEVSEATGMTKQSCYARAGVMRKQGVRLKRLVSRAMRATIDADALNAIIDAGSAPSNGGAKQEPPRWDDKRDGRMTLSPRCGRCSSRPALDHDGLCPQCGGGTRRPEAPIVCDHGEPDERPCDECEEAEDIRRRAAKVRAEPEAVQRSRKVAAAAAKLRERRGGRG